MTTDNTQQISDIDRAKQILAEMVDRNASSAGVVSDVDLDALIASAQERFANDKAANGDEVDITGEAAQFINGLYARQAELKKQADVLSEERERITKLVAGIAADADAKTVKVNGAPVMTRTEVTSRTFNATRAKQLFPDVPEWSELWETKTSVRRLWK